jgi:putative redox protein
VCGAIDITLILKKRKKTIHDFVIEAVGVRKDETPRRFTEVHCKYVITSPDVTEEELNKTAKLSLEKYCSVVATLNCPVTFSVEIIRP